MKWVGCQKVKFEDGMELHLQRYSPFWRTKTKYVLCDQRTV